VLSSPTPTLPLVAIEILVDTVFVGNAEVVGESVGEDEVVGDAEVVGESVGSSVLPFPLI